MTGSRPHYADCADLEAMLGDGWEVEPPVYVRPHWQSRSDSNGNRTYHFVLWRDNQVNLVSIPESPELKCFIGACGLAVDRL
jgi:hypothetical protein